MYRNKTGIFSSNKSISQYVTLVTFISVKYDDITTTNILLFVLESIYQIWLWSTLLTYKLVQNHNLSVCYCMYSASKLQIASMKMTCCKRYLVTGSERTTRWTQRQYSCVVCVCVSISWQYSDFHTLRIKTPCLSKIFFFCTYVCIKLNFTCVCLPSPSHSLLKEHWSWVGPVLSLCIVRKPGAKAQMVSKYLKKTGCS